MVSKIHVHARRTDDGGWAIELPQRAGAAPLTATSRTYNGITRKARELTASPRAEVTITVEAPAQIQQLITDAAAAEVEGRAAIDRGAKLRREAARALRAAGYTAEASAAVLGVSHQRIQQLTTDKHLN